MTNQNTPASHPMPLTQVWVLFEESRMNSCPGEEISLFPSKAAAERERLRRVHERWDELPLFDGDPDNPPADLDKAIVIYNEAREGEYLAAPWAEDVASVPGCRARFLWPDAEEGADPAIEIGGIVVGVREEPEGLVVWIGTDSADDSWPRDGAGRVPLEVVLNDEVVLGGLSEATVPQQTTPQPSALLERLAAQLDPDEGTLDEAVSEVFARRVVAVNNDGPAAQLAVLADEYGEDHLADLLHALVGNNEAEHPHHRSGDHT